MALGHIVSEYFDCPALRSGEGKGEALKKAVEQFFRGFFWNAVRGLGFLASQGDEGLHTE